MPKRLFAIFMFAFCASLTIAATAAQPAKTLLWKVMSGNRTLYLTGDTQALLPRDYPLPVQVDQAFKQSGELVLEGDPAADSKQISELIQRYGLLPTPTTLSNTLNGSEANLVKRTFGQVGTPFETVEPMRPWLAAIVLAQAEHARLGCDPTRQETDYFYKLAKSRDLPFTPLETASDQITLFANLPQSLQIAWLTTTARQWPHAASERQAKRQDIVRAWRTGNISVLSKLLTREFDGQPDLYRALVTNRNEAWFKVLKEKLGQGGAPIFVLIGAGHLVGRDNLVSMLEQAGYGATKL